MSQEVPTTDFTLDPIRNKAVLMLAAGMSTSAIAKQLGICRKTVSRIKAEPECQELLAEAILSIYQVGLSGLCLKVENAVSHLGRIIDDPDTSDRLRLKAIEILFSQLKLADKLLPDAVGLDAAITKVLNAGYEVTERDADA